MIVPRPGLPEDIRLLREEADKFRSLYYYRHMACPKCGSIYLETTYMGVVMNLGDMDSYRDTNTAKCRCGWKGIVHDLKGGV